MLTEETPYGEIGQLYVTIKKVLDKYYYDAATDSRIGISETETAIRTRRSSSSGIPRRSDFQGVCYPGFGSTGAYDDAQGFMPMYFPKNMVNQSFYALNGTLQKHERAILRCAQAYRRRGYHSAPHTVRHRVHAGWIV